jgi:hypothetical protein
MGGDHAVFIQSSTQFIGGKYKYAHNLWSGRALPIARTWASRTPDAYFVLGSSDSNRMYTQVAWKPIIGSNFYTQQFSCGDIEKVAQSMQVLYVQNCADTYSGLSQTCRLQETMRYVLYADSICSGISCSTMTTLYELTP